MSVCASIVDAEMMFTTEIESVVLWIKDFSLP